MTADPDFCLLIGCAPLFRQAGPRLSRTSDRGSPLQRARADTRLLVPKGGVCQTRASSSSPFVDSTTWPVPLCCPQRKDLTLCIGLCIKHLARTIHGGSWRPPLAFPQSKGYPAVAREGDPLLFSLQWVREEPGGTDAYWKQYVEGLSGEPARLHAAGVACRPRPIAPGMQWVPQQRIPGTRCSSSATGEQQKRS